MDRETRRDFTLRLRRDVLVEIIRMKRFDRVLALCIERDTYFLSEELYRLEEQRRAEARRHGDLIEELLLVMLAPPPPWWKRLLWAISPARPGRPPGTRSDRRRGGQPTTRGDRR